MKKHCGKKVLSFVLIIAMTLGMAPTTLTMASETVQSGETQTVSPEENTTQVDNSGSEPADEPVGVSEPEQNGGSSDFVQETGADKGSGASSDSAQNDGEKNTTPELLQPSDSQQNTEPTESMTDEVNNGEAETETFTGTQDASETEVGTDDIQESESEKESGIPVETETETATETETLTETETETEDETETATDTEMETETETETLTETESETAAEIGVQIAATVTYTKKLEKDQFTFYLKEVDVENGLRLTAKNGADGSVVFDEITYDEPGVYHYRVTQENGGETVDNVKYDGRVYNVYVTVEENEDGLTASVDKGANDVVFANEYEEPVVEKKYKKEFHYSDGRVSITARATEGANFPEDAQIHADYMEPGSAAYEEAVAILESDYVTDDVLDYVLYDIYFTSETVEGRLEPEDGTVSVEMTFNDPILVQDDDIEVQAQEVVHISDGSADVISTQDFQSTDGVSSVSFSSDEFSPFAFSLIGSGKKKTAMISSEGEKLENIAENLSVQAQGNMDALHRSGSFQVAVSYSLADDNIVNAAEHTPWIYDLEAFVEKYPAIKGIKDTTGAIMMGGYERGTYKIEGNKVYLYPDVNWLKTQTNNVSGTFNLEVELNSEEIGTTERFAFEFPGAGKIEGKYEEVDLTTSKTVDGLYYGTDLDVSKDSNGDYVLKYYVKIKPNADLDSLVLLDTLSSGQTVDPDSFSVSGNSFWNESVSSDSIVSNSDGFKFDLSGWLEGKGYSVTAGVEYTISYSVKLSADAFGKIQTNSAEWTWEGGTKPGGSTEVIPYKKLENVEKTVKVDEQTGYAEYTYTITVGDEGTDLAGHTISDTMSNNQKLKGKITLKGPDGTTTEIDPSITYGADYRFDNNDVRLFTYTFDTDKVYKGPYTITYTTTTDGVTGVEGKQSIKNKADDDDGHGGKGSDDTSETHDFGVKQEEIGIEKSFLSWNESESTASWTIDVNVNAESADLPLKNVVVKEEEANYGFGAEASWKRPENLEILWDQTVIKTQSGTTLTKGEDYQIDEANGTITFAELSESVTITLVTRSKDGFTNAANDEFWAYNKASVEFNGKKKEDYALEKYVSHDYTLTKSGAYDPGTGVFSWTVTLNPNCIDYGPDVFAWFSDDLPEGHEPYIESWEQDFMIQVTAYENGNQKDQYRFPVKVDGNHIQVFDAGEGKDDKGVPTGKHYELSNYRFVIFYKTKLTQDELDNNKGVEKEYTNTAYLEDGDGNHLAEGNATVKRNGINVKKEDKGLTNDIITYEIDVNPEEGDLDPYSDVISLSDTFEEGVELSKNTVTVTKADGTSLDNVHISYSDRTLKIVLPDETHVKVTFKVQVQSLGNAQFKNEAILRGEAEYRTSVEQWHNVQNSSATITGDKNQITLTKIDEDDLTKPLPDAKFSLYQVSTEEDELNGTLVGQDYTSDAKGIVTFSGLTAGALYYWQETKAPDGYEVAQDGKNYFVMYSAVIEYNVEDAAKTAENKRAAQEQAKKWEEKYNIEILVVKDQYNWTVSNKKKQEKGKLEIIKTIGDGDLSKDTLTSEQKEKIQFRVIGPNGYNKTFTYAQMTEGKMLLEDLQIGEYQVIETNGNLDGYTVETKYSVTDGKTTVKANDTATVTVTNTYTQQKGKLTVTKSFAGDKLTDEQKEAITFTVTGPNNYKKTFTYANMANGSMTLDDLVPGEYTVTESKAGVDGYTVETEYSVTDGKTKVEANKTAEVIVTNTYTQQKGKLTVTKSFAGDKLTDEQKEAITFTVTGPNNYEKTFTYANMANGSMTLDDLVPGEYTVTESKAGVDGYTVETEYSVTDGKTKVEANKTVEVIVTNNYTEQKEKLGALRITKSFEGGATLTDEQKARITFTVTGPNGYSEEFTYAEMIDGVKELKDLVPGEYQVTEKGAAVEEYELTTTYSVEDGKVEVVGETTVEVKITNTYDTPDTTPETESTTPETESTTPETESTTPETESTTPETESTTTETESTTTETESTTPQTESTTETESTTPETVPATTPETTNESWSIPSYPSEEGGGDDEGVLGSVRNSIGGVLGAMRGVLGAVRTGDDSVMLALIYIVIIGAATAAIVIVVVRRKRKDLQNR